MVSILGKLLLLASLSFFSVWGWAETFEDLSQEQQRELQEMGREISRALQLALASHEPAQLITFFEYLASFEVNLYALAEVYNQEDPRTGFPELSSDLPWEDDPEFARKEIPANDVLRRLGLLDVLRFRLGPNEVAPSLSLIERARLNIQILQSLLSTRNWSNTRRIDKLRKRFNSIAANGRHNYVISYQPLEHQGPTLEGICERALRTMAE